jgi:hypothetical protein
MSWKCPTCGTENPPAGKLCLAACGYVRLPARLVLTSLNTGRKLQIRVTTAVGQSLLRTVAAADAPYASEPQFEIVKDQVRGAWVVRHHAKAHNPTYYNGNPCGGDPHVLENDAVLSIGRERLKLTVTLEYE